MGTTTDLGYGILSGDVTGPTTGNTVANVGTYSASTVDSGVALALSGSASRAGTAAFATIAGSASTSGTAAFAVTSGGGGGATPSVRVAYNAPNQTVTAGSWQTIKYLTVITDAGTAYSTTSGTFTVPTTGLYQFTASIKSTTAFVMTAGNEMAFKILKNGSTIIAYYTADGIGITANEVMVGPAGAPASLTAGDTIDVQAYSTGNSFVVDTTVPAASVFSIVSWF